MNNIKKVIVISIILLVSTAFKSDSIVINTFENEYLSFQYPDDWEITSNEKVEEGTYYISLMKKGDEPTGLITIFSINELYNLDDLIANNVSVLEDEELYKNADFSPIVDGQFNKIQTRKSKAVFRIFGVEHESIMMVFNNEKNSYIILKQEATEDRKHNANGFKIFEQSFKAK